MIGILEYIFTSSKDKIDLEYRFQTRDIILNQQDGLSNYIKYILDNPDLVQFETQGKLSCSQSKPRIIDKKYIPESEYTNFALRSGYRGLGQEQHSKFQEYLLEHDPLTLCVELPVWNDLYAGHIDAVRLIPNQYDSDFKIHILDLKPESRKIHQKIMSQLFLYRDILSQRSRIPLSKIDCFYFDDQVCFKLDL